MWNLDSYPLWVVKPGRTSTACSLAQRGCLPATDQTVMEVKIMRKRDGPNLDTRPRLEVSPLVKIAQDRAGETATADNKA